VNGNARILDVGSGRGYITLLLAARRPAATLTGVDFSVMQVRAAERLRKRRGIANCRFEVENAMRLPYVDNSFDAVVSVGSIKHWPDPQRGITEIHRVLVPEGWAVVSETDRDVSTIALRRFIQRFTAWFFWDPLLLWGLRHIIFGRSFSEREIVAFAETAGFREIRTERLATCPYVIVNARK
jgi:ubiquinone/menaquinone biosynthesis C-methylase UbiE